MKPTRRDRGVHPVLLARRTRSVHPVPPARRNRSGSGPGTAGFRASNVLVSCEHGSNRIPAGHRGLGLTKNQLESHVAWDRGAGSIARRIAARIGCPCHVAQWSRLVVDLNRRLDHPKLMAAESFGVRVPGNACLTVEEHARRLRRYYLPYRNAVAVDVLQLLSETGSCLHLSIHSFTPILAGQVRDADIGLLYDPRRRREVALARRLQPLLEAHGLRVRMNYPYLGTSDGFVTWFRKQLPAPRYAGIEIETNQRLLQTPAGALQIGRILAACVAAALVE